MLHKYPSKVYLETTEKDDKQRAKNQIKCRNTVTLKFERTTQLLV